MLDSALNLSVEPMQATVHILQSAEDVSNYRDVYARSL